MKPITREEMYLAAAAGYAVTPPEPVTRKEMFLAKLAGMEVETPAVFTRQERFLDEAAARAPSMTINNQDITVTENGQYTADEGYTGLGTVTVEVPDEPAVLEDLEVNENGNYTPSDGVDGFSSVKVAVPIPEPVAQPLQITENGTYTAPDGVDGYSPVTVAVPVPEIKLQEKTVTENGEVTADAGFDGLLKVLVDVAGSANIVKKSGTISKSDGSEKTISHNLGVIPDLVMVFPNSSASTLSLSGNGVICLVQGKAQTLFHYRYGYSLYRNDSSLVAYTDTVNYLDDGTASFYWAGATATTVTLPARPTGVEYHYVIIAGLS